MKRLLAVLAAAFIFIGGQIFVAAAETCLDAAKKQIMCIENIGKIQNPNLRRKAIEADLWRPKVVTYESERGIPANPNPDESPVSRTSAVVPAFPARQVIPPQKKPAVVVPSSKPAKKPTSSVSVQSSQSAKSLATHVSSEAYQTAVGEIKREKKQDVKDGVVSNVEINHINVAMLLTSQSLRTGMKIAIETKPGSGLYRIGVIRERLTPHGTVLDGEINPEPVKKIPAGYQIIKLQEVKS